MSSHLDLGQQRIKVSINAHSNLDEKTLLLKKYGYTSWSTLRRRYKNTRKCISSKGALAILMWSFAVLSLYCFRLNLDSSTQPLLLQFIFIDYGVRAAIYCFYPIAGYLADHRCGRYKTVVFGLWLLLPSILLSAIYISLVIIFNFHVEETIVPVFLFEIIFVLLLALSTVSFNANVIQLGMDQLYDFPVEDQSLFIHWFVWVFYLTVFLVDLIGRMISFLFTEFYGQTNIKKYEDYKNIGYSGIGALILFSIMLLVLLVVSLCIAHCKKHWFLIEPSRVNPYKLVYLVTKFAWQHKVPVNRSAFTYCEDDIPSGLNLAKDKYGGPYTTEQVEDVKVFYGILKVLFSLGPVFFLEFAADATLRQFTLHGSIFNFTHSNFSNIVFYNSEPAEVLLIKNGLLTPLLTTICIPLYLFLLRPFLLNYVPGMLKRMGIGATMTVLSLICTVAIGAWSHTRYDVGCMFDPNSVYLTLNDTFDPPSLAGPFYNTFLVAIQRVLISLSNMLIYVALFEFICSQSPHSMKGLLIGLAYAIKGLFQVIAALLALPFALAMDNTHISCGVSYYIMNAGVGVVTVLVYVWVSRKYKYRERDEPSNIYMYAENYYSKGPPEE